jgi:hypothetical protein
MISGNIVLIQSKKGNNFIETFISKAIRFITRSEYSHSLVTLPQLLTCDMCVEAASNGVTMQRFDTTYWTNPTQACDVYEIIGISQDIKDAAAKSILNDLDTSYGYLELPWFIWRALNKAIGRDIKSHNNWCQNGDICSWLCTLYLTACGLGYLFEGYGKCSVCPQDLRNIFDANPTLFKKVASTF